MTPRYRQKRDAVERIVLGCVLVLDEAAHLGGADPDATSDRPLLRGTDGRIYLAGTSLKGVLRRGQGPARLFGGDTNQARLIVDDAPMVSDDETEIRDGVAIDRALGIAADKKKYDIELVPAGARFSARFEAVIPSQERDLVVRDLCAALDQLTDGIEVGARTRRGFGRIRRRGPWSVERYAGTEGLRAWLARGCAGAPRAWLGSASETDSLWETLGVQDRPAPPDLDAEISLELKLVGSLLIRSPAAGSSPADVAQLHTRGDGTSRPVVSGTSLAGALRSRCLRIANTLLPSGADELVDGLFGPAKVASGDARASRLRVGEAPVEGARTLRHTRVRIDPWTGGAAESLLFTAEPAYGGTLRTFLRWKRPRDKRREAAERALLLLALRDLALGDLALGGEVGTGRGRFAPMHADGRFGRFDHIELRLTPERGLAGEFSADLDILRGWSDA